ncbi:hypothetical protein A2331_00595 [Candidatus Falkowbacteria bacterium RIFOXYB2_FULL_34_18]|uniref:Uncharacterized protein n=1 Tax=Candidatus Falkowbacteria bacterium RIFOXYD2_FULL_34_120 TaxID=1798007 RepID=A0A1F5TM60_9BACT|nr:MAG: hypothetical protein A2331_00595 [Candidatus Falkowbacteria bacterium RIFOXYB2_FULL_34_18]OGF29190.1 MAG: hypothetical protein A2500_05910 [Candidatus Falkowbacteria bacterium RIFOXYC12_FULL_34_55]OGF37728.1 MAG: hypothetical protein A2466_06240 [Candidatus Falkowbacteria bacterium RIFOXYC2_FULL_34_220]OGF38712.1 MAG: hypothetical protein A2515_01575 [Candidatus Falkowbacteria bacterium RIFOXYD12_FULL_34_57]OGF39946.1 MAG: hypothetical protein A2531_01830 [Candidatus Falkowbacteria bact
MNLSGIKNEGIWRNDGYEEEYEFLKDLGVQALAVEHITVAFKDDKSYSTSFEMRHVVDSEGNRGFMCFVSKRLLYMDTYRQGTTQEVYDEVKSMGETMQQEELRRSWLNLN